MLWVAAIAAAVSPLTFSSSIGFIGSLAIFSMFSILILGVIVSYRCAQCVLENGMPSLTLVNTADNGMSMIRRSVGTQVSQPPASRSQSISVGQPYLAAHFCSVCFLFDSLFFLAASLFSFVYSFATLIFFPSLWSLRGPHGGEPTIW